MIACASRTMQSSAHRFMLPSKAFRASEGRGVRQSARPGAFLCSPSAVAVGKSTRQPRQHTIRAQSSSQTDSSDVSEQLKGILNEIKERDPDQEEFHQAVEEVLNTVEPLMRQHPEYMNPLRRLVEPERTVIFRIPWVDDNGQQWVQRGYRVQYNSALGPYKGGLRFSPTVTLSIVKFLAFEQTLKNALTMLFLGGGKGGSDFNPKGRSDGEIMRFCQAYMNELLRHIGPDTDVPAGDMGSIGYLFGQYTKMRQVWGASLTGKPYAMGGSALRPEATGYGLVYFVQHILEGRCDQGGIDGKRVAVSGAGNVSTYAMEKLLERGAVPVTMSDSSGTVYEPDGFTQEGYEQVVKLKGEGKKLSEYQSPGQGKYHEGAKPWQVVESVDIALPCATQNEIEETDIDALKQAGCTVLAEGANMALASGSVEAVHKAGIEYGPAKAANAGGVAVSGLEMSQNSMWLQWSREDVDEKLQQVMKGIYDTCNNTAKQYDTTLQAGANIASFQKVMQAMVAQGVV